MIELKLRATALVIPMIELTLQTMAREITIIGLKLQATAGVIPMIELRLQGTA